MVRKDTMRSALEEAGKNCEYWMMVATGRILNKDIMTVIAEKHDKEVDLPKETFYLVSSEGAIGMAAVYEYLTEWLFIPAEPEAIERGKIEDENAMYLEAIRTQPDEVDEIRFCRNCGAKLRPQAQFCAQCGTKL